MSDEMKIGVTNLEGGVKKEWFTIEAGQDNEFRILPPLFSLAEKGKFSQYAAVHKVWFKDPAYPNGKPRPYSFNCIKKVNRESKEVEMDCPYCVRYDAAKLKYDAGKAQGASADQLKEFNFSQVMPYQVEKKFYVNAVNASGKVGLLPLGIKAFQALQAELVSAKNKLGIDATGMEGLYFNFSKTQKFKGDRDTVYGVQLASEVVKGSDGKISTTLKQHSITGPFIAVIKAGARDLGDLFKDINLDQINQLMSMTDDTKKATIEAVFGKYEKKAQAASAPVASTPSHAWSSAPVVGSVAPAPVAAAEVPFSFEAPLVAAHASAKTNNPLTMSDDDFVNAFG
jgi:hypothetical protein